MMMIIELTLDSSSIIFNYTALTPLGLTQSNSMKKFMVYRIVQICGATIYRKTVSFSRHTTHVGALAWNDYCLLANGGGTTDRYIRFWNILIAQSLQCIDTGSQICNLAWSKHSNELVPTHG
ncbi:unnamed protein product [Rotaria sordida]|uniref:Uncharacterized protein n=1 Tax=Rotaria sordida TaxID=392033 RepID=A0A815FLQ3_9BILA|nr:unnamed protein product [Rotaria sordida]CAF1589871.1 unnamed protein product [Rotaria sordida]